jgi:3-methyladenine DNA glycosylase AlkD
MAKILDQIRQDLKKNADEKTRESGRRYFKEDINLYGVKTATVSKIAKERFKEIKDLKKKELLALCEELWRSGVMEESFIACQWSHLVRKQYEPRDFKIFEKWVDKYVTNWAACDTLCNHTVGDFVMVYPEYLADLMKWTRSRNRWCRRAAAVSLIIPARRGLFLPEIFRIADNLLTDADDLVQKGYGWMLKAASEARQKEVFDYVMRNKQIMPRTALRYAIEKMPTDLKAQAMDK